MDINLQTEQKEKLLYQDSHLIPAAYYFNEASVETAYPLPIYQRKWYKLDQNTQVIHKTDTFQDKKIWDFTPIPTDEGINKQHMKIHTINIDE